MGFELPWALAGLLAVAAPIVAHLIRRRDLDSVPLPTIALLARAQAKSRRRMRLVDLLLLLSRVLLVALLALALARPFVSVPLAWGQDGLVSLAIVVDDSMSMARRGSGGTLLADALGQVDEAVAALSEGSEVAVVLGGDPARVLVARTEDLDLTRRTVLEVPDTSARSGDLATAVALATRELHGARHAARRLVVLSDFANHTEAHSIKQPPDGVELSPIRVGPKDEDWNLTVSEAIAVPDPQEPTQVVVQVTVRRFGGEDGPITVRLSRDGRDLDSTDTTTEGGVARFTMRAPMIAEGHPTAHVRVESDDALQVDNQRGVLLRAPVAARLLIVNGDPHASRQDDEVAFVTRALDAAPREQGTITYRVVDSDTLGAHTLETEDVVVLANVTAPTRAVGQRLAQFVEAGGGLLIAAGDHVDPRAYRARFGDLLPADPEPRRVGEVRGLTPEGGFILPVGLGQVVTKERLGLGQPRAQGKVLLSFGDGSPAVVVGRSGRGTVGILATTLDDDWTDLPYRPGFVPLTVELTGALAEVSRVPDRSYRAGHPVRMSLSAAADRGQVTLPSGATHDLDDRDESGAFTFERTLEAGAYGVTVGHDTTTSTPDPRAAFVVAAPVEESDLAPGPIPAVTEAATSQEKHGAAKRSLAPWLFLLAGLLALVEGLLRRRLRGRFRRADVMTLPA